MKKLMAVILILFMSFIPVLSYPGNVFASEDVDIEEDYDEEYVDEEYEEEEAAEEQTEAETEAETKPAAEGSTVRVDENGWPVAPEVISGSVMMVEVNTGAVLYTKDEDVQRYPASTTKILTCLIALENCSFTETVRFSANAVDLEEGATSIDAVEGEEMSMKDCLYGLMLPSGNDCAIAIAEHIAGSVEAFAEIMNARAAEIGCESSNFVNPEGLFHRDHYTTASDLCKIARVAFNNSAFVEIVSHVTYTIPETNKSEPRLIENTNYMIDPTSSYYYENIVGGKTGYLYESGRCLVTLAKKNGLTVVTVVMFCSNYTGVFIDTEELLDYVFNGFALNNIAETESRFTYSCDASKIKLDATAQILMPRQLEMTDLVSDIEFTYDMDMDEFAEASEKAGITSRDGRHLYAIINYYYANNYLGHVNVLIDDNMQVPKAVFASTTYVNTFWVILFTAVFIALVIFISVLISKAPERRRKRKTKIVQTQTPDGQPIPLNIINARTQTGMTQTSTVRGKTTRVRLEEETPVRRRPSSGSRSKPKRK